MGPPLFPTVFWCDAPEAGLIGAVSLFKFRLHQAPGRCSDHPRLPMVPFTGDRGSESVSLQRRVSCEPRSREKLGRRCHDVDKRGQLRFRAGDAPLPAPTRASRASISQKSSRSAAVKLRTRLRQPRRRQDCDPLPNASCYRNSGRSESGCDTASRSYILRSLDDSAARHPPQDGDSRRPILSTVAAQAAAASAPLTTKWS